MDRQTTQRNMRYLVLEIFWAAIFNGCIAFNAAYIIRLGGSNLLVSLLTSGAALVNAIAALPFAAFLERRANRRPWMLWSIAIVRLGHLGLIAIPWLLTGSYRAEAVVVLLIALNVPVALFTAAFLPMLADVIPLPQRARVFSARNITLGATVAVCTFLFGQWLDRAPFPFNYQLLFAFGVVAATLSTLYLTRLTIPASRVSPSQTRQPFNLALIRHVWREQRPFVNITINTLVFNLAFWMAVPLQPIYFVRVLGASDGWLGLWTTLVSAGTIGGNLLWERMIRRYGFGWALLRAAFLSGIYYMLIAIFPNLTLILIFGLLAGLISPGIDLSHFNLLLEVTPEERRATYLGLFVTVMNIGFFVVPLAIAPLSALIGEQMLVLALGVMRLIGALLFVLNPIRTPSMSGQLAVDGGATSDS